MNSHSYKILLIVFIVISIISEEILAQRRINPPYISADCLSIFLKGRVFTNRRNVVVFKNESYLTLKLILKEKNGKQLDSFTLIPNQVYAIKDRISKKNYKYISVFCIYDEETRNRDLLAIDQTRVERNAAIKYQNILWAAINQLFIKPLLPGEVWLLAGITQYLASDEFSGELDSEDLRYFGESGLNYLINKILTKQFGKEGKAMLRAVESSLREALKDPPNYTYEDLKRYREYVWQSFNNNDFETQNIYDFVGIATNTKNFKDPIPNTFLSIGGLTGLQSYSEGPDWESEQNTAFNLSLKLKRNAFSLLTTANNFYIIGLSGFYEDYRRLRNSNLSLDMKGFGGGLTLSYFGRDRTLGLYILSLEGGIVHLDTKLTDSQNDSELSIINAPAISPYGELTFHISPGYSPISFDLGLQLVITNFKFKEEVTQPSFSLPEALFRVKLGISLVRR